MITPEILSKLAPKTQNYSGIEDVDLKWQDLLQAMRGLDPGKTGFLLYVYGNYPKGRHDFWAGLFMEIMQRHEVQLWIHQRRQQNKYDQCIEAMCVLAVQEWREGSDKFTHQRRADLMGVSRGTWNRRYKLIYETIVSTPQRWQDEVMLIINQRLK